MRQIEKIRAEYIDKSLSIIKIPDYILLINEPVHQKPLKHLMKAASKRKAWKYRQKKKGSKPFN